MQAIRWGAALAVLTFNAAAQAASPCDNPTDQTTMNQCAGKALAASDKQLNDVYRSLNQKVSPEGKVALQRSQRAWIAWRDAQCAFETIGTAGGSVHAAMYASCVDELTQAQTKRLSAVNTCQEGDVSCIHR
ncbi:hypothetical protein PHO31112_02128 [Pandoraea horticolens]|uniref:Lysozyme inhibitor LprI-like N-terminal domain-containing protein n=1 Tax=Pandoraea horticolens TaxID=2508298 RepID=A0A5E4ULW3_9BURK|nr:lysozyme inhibitor LprI family protein [Pandoraea horticolens]VVE00912.1 hypothetical protein PHO31112_02128 [Pandoraea horticolens]